MPFSVAAAMAVGCRGDQGGTLPRPPIGSIGEETFGVLCDRVGAQSLRDDLTGEASRAVCHRSPTTGLYADHVDPSVLPPLTPGARSPSGDEVPMEVQMRDRSRSVARIEALARHRNDLIVALDTLFPSDQNVSTSCDPSVQVTLPRETADWLARLIPSYKDGTLPDASRAWGRLAQMLEDSPDARSAIARMDARRGYLPPETALGVMRPLLAYPGLRDLANALLRRWSSDVSAFWAEALEEGEVTGPDHDAWTRLIDLLSIEFRAATEDPTPAPLGDSAMDPNTGLPSLRRARTPTELLAEVLVAGPLPGNRTALGECTHQDIVRRDVRGYAKVSSNGAPPAPFVDLNLDGLADINPLGQFITTNAIVAPSPFLDGSAEVDSIPRDSVGRALNGRTNALFYEYVDTSCTVSAALARSLVSLVNPDVSAKHESLMDAAAGAYVLLGPRGKMGSATRRYKVGKEVVEHSYAPFQAEESPLADLSYALGKILSSPNTEPMLATAGWLLDHHESDLAKVAAVVLQLKASADQHTEAQIPEQSQVWDELIDVAAKIASDTDDDGNPVLLQDLLEALADEDSSTLATVAAAFMKFRDEITYDRQDFNGPPFNITTGQPAGEIVTPVDRSQPDRGYNRSLFQRFIQALHDANGVTVCNRPGAVVKAHVEVPGYSGLYVDVSIPDDPLLLVNPYGKTSFAECEVFKVDDLAAFYIDSMAGRAEYYVRDQALREGIALNVGPMLLTLDQTAVTVTLLEDSSGITGYQLPGTTLESDRTGFWTERSSRTLYSRPEWFNRGVFLHTGGNGDKDPDRVEFFSKHLNPDRGSTRLCPIRIVDDPLPPNDPAYTPGGKISLRDCKTDEYSLNIRNPHTIFAAERFDFYRVVEPIARALTNDRRRQSSLAIEALDVLHRHWASSSGSDWECRLGTDPNDMCTRDGLVSYEPFLIEILSSELFPTIRALIKGLRSSQFYHPCATREPSTRACVAGTITGMQALARVARDLVDPKVSAERGLTDRYGRKTATRKDGTINPQVTPIYLLTDAIQSFDRAFADYKRQHPSDGERQTQWRRARSQWVDAFLSASRPAGSREDAAYHFDNAAVPTMIRIVIDLLRQQLVAKCSEWPAQPCRWIGETVPSDLVGKLRSPMTAAAADVLEALRADEASRVELERLLTYLLSSESAGGARSAVLASIGNLVQVLQDDANLVPLLHLLGGALAQDPDGSAAQLTESTLALLTRLVARAYDQNGQERCDQEVDPTGVLFWLLRAAVTPMAGLEHGSASPVEVFADTILDVNRVDASSREKLTDDDFAHLSHGVCEFLTDEQRGLEQLYEIVRKAHPE